MTQKSASSAGRLLLTHREQAVLLERAKVHADGGRVIYRTSEDGMRKDYAIPHANLAVLFLGQGTSITQEAARLLSAEGVFVAFTGTGGTPLHYGALTSYTGTAAFRRMLTAYVSPEASLALAKAFMRERLEAMEKIGLPLCQSLDDGFPDEALLRAISGFQAGIQSADGIPQLLGHEGVYSKQLYAVMAKGFRGRAGDNFTREAGAGRSDSWDDIVNGLIDHGNYLAYGMAGATLWGLGIPPHLPVFHGKTRAGGLVFDLADTFKEAIILPFAFHPGKKAAANQEQIFRARVLQAFEREQILKRLFRLMDRHLPAERLGAHLNPGETP